VNNSLLWYASRGAGAVTLILLSGVVVLGLLSVLRFEAAGWPRFLTAALHRNLALLSVLFLALHIVTAVVDPYINLGWAVAVLPFSSSYRTLWLGLGTVAAELVAAVVLTSLLRRVLGRAAWRGAHWLAYLAWPVALVHGLGTGTDSGSSWMLAIDVFCAGSVVVALGVRVWNGSLDPLATARTVFRAAVERQTP
jgi:methionine sulfoxide reductase heme-binding subunit